MESPSQNPWSGHDFHSSLVVSWRDRDNSDPSAWNYDRAPTKEFLQLCGCRMSREKLQIQGKSWEVGGGMGKSRWIRLEDWLGQRGVSTPCVWCRSGMSSWNFLPLKKKSGIIVFLPKGAWAVMHQDFGMMQVINRKSWNGLGWEGIFKVIYSTLTPSTIPGGSKPHQTWPWTLPGTR